MYACRIEPVALFAASRTCHTRHLFLLSAQSTPVVSESHNMACIEDDRAVQRGQCGHGTLQNQARRVLGFKPMICPTTSALTCRMRNWWFAIPLKPVLRCCETNHDGEPPIHECTLLLPSSSHSSSPRRSKQTKETATQLEQLEVAHCCPTHLSYLDSLPKTTSHLGSIEIGRLLRVKERWLSRQ